jgi:transmembrane sensor
MTPQDDENRTAGHWFIANQAGPLTDEDAKAFMAWLQASPIHIKEYLDVARVSRHFKVAAGDPEVPLQSFLEQVRAEAGDVTALVPPTLRQLPSGGSAFGRRSKLAAVGALAAVAAVAVWWAHDGELLGIPKTYQTVHGGQRIQRLPDGSTLHLDSDSVVTVRYSGGERLVELTRGRALFRVMHEDSRRFRVAAGVAGAIAVGTRFQVSLSPGVATVTVAEGRVAVFPGEPKWLGGADIPTDVQRVDVGYQARIDDRGVSVVRPVDLDQAVAWAEHRILFKQRPLGEVAAEFNRYGRIPVEIEDSALRALPVTGMLDASDTESFIAFLETLPGVRVEQTPTRIKVVKATPAP